MIEELIQLSISTIRLVTQSELLSFICKVFAIVIGYEEGRWRYSSFVPGTGVSSQADDDIATFSHPMYH